MKKIMALISLFILIFALSGCSRVEPTDANSNLARRGQAADIEVSSAEAGEFSYEEDLKKYKENDPGVYYDGFSNTSSLKLSDTEEVIKRAEAECTIEYDTTTVYYDSAAGIWKTVFSTAGTLGNCQSVYLNGDGVTCLIVYGE